MNQKLCTRFILFVLVFFGLQLIVRADNLEIIEVKKSIPLSNDEKSVTDYYINLKAIDGIFSKQLSKNSVVNVYRKISLKNESQKLIGEFQSLIGQLKVIKVEGGIAIARMYKIYNRETEPILDIPGFLVGDKVELAKQ